MNNEIPVDELKYQKLVSKVQLRMLRAAAYSMPRREEFVRFYKIYRKIQDAVMDPDEPNIFLGYAFGLIEQITSQCVEPILKMRPPCKPLPMRLGDTKQADNFSQVAANYYAKPTYQDAFTRASKEKVICGTKIEVDEWTNIIRKGKMWGKVPQDVEADVVGPDGKPTGVKSKTSVLVDAEVDRDIPIHKGFMTRFPSIFNGYFEPDRKTIATGLPTDCSWYIEDMGDMALEDMVLEKIIDPATGQPQPLYDFGKLLHDSGSLAEERYKKLMLGAEAIDDNYGPLINPVRKWNFDTDFGQIDKGTMYPTEGSVDRQSTEDRDKIWVCRMYEPDQIITIANGTYIIQRKCYPWHVPIMPIRVDCYTVDPEFLYGHGAIEPIEDEIYSLNDIENLTMSNWIRIINKMIAVKEDAIVTMNDFKPRAGGKIRLRGDMAVGNSIMPIDQQDPTQSMLMQSSNKRGLIEYTSSVMDGSPGIGGTKQDHKTKGGLQQIAAQLSIRRQTCIRQTLVNSALQMLSMERFFSQFQFEKQPFRIYRDDGSTALAEFNKDDIYTEGRGFEYLLEIDPNFGDTMVERQQNLFLFDKAIEYEKFRVGAKDQDMRKVDLSKLFEKILKNFGYRDTTYVFGAPTHEQTPENELQILMQGGVAQCSGDLQKHITTHLLQRDSPMLKKAVEAGKASPDTMRRLELLIQQAMAQLTAFVRDPQFAANQKKSIAMGPQNSLSLNGQS